MTATARAIIADPDASSRRLLYLPGMDFLSPAFAYLLGSEWGAPSDTYKYDWSGNGRTLTDVGTPTIGDRWMSSSLSNGLQVPMSMSQMFAVSGAVTLMVLAKAPTSGNAQLIGNNASSGNIFLLSATTTNAHAVLNNKDAARPYDTGKAQEWGFYCLRAASNNLDLLFWQEHMTDTALVEPAAFTGQLVTDTSNLRIGTTEGVAGYGGAAPIMAAVGFTSFISDPNVDLWRDQLVSRAIRIQEMTALAA